MCSVCLSTRPRCPGGQVSGPAWLSGSGSESVPCTLWSSGVPPAAGSTLTRVLRPSGQWPLQTLLETLPPAPAHPPPGPALFLPCPFARTCPPPARPPASIFHTPASPLVCTAAVAGGDRPFPRQGLGRPPSRGPSCHPGPTEPCARSSGPRDAFRASPVTSRSCCRRGAGPMWQRCAPVPAGRGEGPEAREGMCRKAKAPEKQE